VSTLVRPPEPSYSTTQGATVPGRPIAIPPRGQDDALDVWNEAEHGSSWPRPSAGHAPRCGMASIARFGELRKLGGFGPGVRGLEGREATSRE
jgi:hypothetical protein